MPPAEPLELTSWFLEPVPRAASRWTRVRVWGLPVSAPAPKRWFRSSSVRARLAPTLVATRFGTTLRLRGPLAREYAARLRMPARAAARFARGFPPAWADELAAAAAPPPRRSSRLAAAQHPPGGPAPPQRHPELQPHGKDARQPLPATAKPPPRPKRPRPRPAQDTARAKPAEQRAEVSTPPSPMTTSEHRIQPRPTARPRRACAARKTNYAEQLSPSPDATHQPPRETAPAVSRPRHARFRLPGSDDRSSPRIAPADKPKKNPRKKRVAFADIKQAKPRPPPLGLDDATLDSTQASLWTSEQREAFERQRNCAPAEDPDYWTIFAAGVDGKTPAECRAFWESSGLSPVGSDGGKQRGGHTGRRKPPKSPKISTPEVVMHVRKASRRKASRNTAKYRTGLRRLAEVIARDTSDDLLEPPIQTPKLADAPFSLNPGPATAPFVTTAGTPGTEVRQKMHQVRKDGELATPEILARGRSFGLREADQYVSLFKRRLGTASIPRLKDRQGELPKKDSAQKPPQRQVLPQTSDLPMEDEESEPDSELSDDGDLFF